MFISLIDIAAQQKRQCQRKIAVKINNKAYLGLRQHLYWNIFMKIIIFAKKHHYKCLRES